MLVEGRRADIEVILCMIRVRVEIKQPRFEQDIFWCGFYPEACPVWRKMDKDLIMVEWLNFQ